MTDYNQFNQPLGQFIEHWQGARKPEKKALKGQYCNLEPMSIELHAKKLFHHLSHNNQGQSWTYLPYGPFETQADFSAWLATTMLESDTQLYVILNEQKEPVGIAGYLRINPEHGVIEIGHLHYAQSLQKTAAATEAMYLMMCYAFDELGYRRYEWKCNSLNEASKNAALRLGFTFEGMFRQNYVFKKRNRDTLWFSILDSEWPQIKIKLAQWLDQKNFDAQGKQIKSLAKISI